MSRLAPFREHPLYDEIVAVLPQGDWDWSEATVPVGKVHNMSLQMGDWLPQQLGYPDFRERLTKFEEQADKFEVLNFLGTYLYQKLFIKPDSNVKEIADVIQATDRHLVESHGFHPEYTERELWSNAFARFYGVQLGYFDDKMVPLSLMGELSESSAKLERYSGYINQILPDIHEQTRTHVYPIYLKFVKRMAHDCHHAEVLANNTEDEAVRILAPDVIKQNREEYMEQNDHASSNVLDELMKVLGRRLRNRPSRRSGMDA